MPASRLDELRAITTFLRAAERGSFHQAAQAQGTTPQAVSKAIRQLEQHLGVRLFHRSTRRSTLTEEGQRLLASVRENVEGLAGALERARDAAQGDRGLVRVAAGGSVARKVLMPLLAEYRRDHPGITFDLVLEDRDTDAVGERIDIGLRAGNPPAAQVVTRRLFPIQLFVCASPEYLARHAAPRQLDDLQDHPCIGYRQPGTARAVAWEFRVGEETVLHPVPAVVCCSDPEAEMQAVLAGIGIGQIDSINAAGPIRAGRLVPLLVQHVSDRMGLHLYYGHRKDMPARVRGFIDFVAARLRGGEGFHLPAPELQALARR